MTTYPKDSEIKVEFTIYHKIILIVTTILILFYLFYFEIKHIDKIFLVFGLYLDIIGVVIASLKTPFYGSFHDGGKIELKRIEKEKKYFQAGMILIAIGFIFQTIGTML